MIIEMKHELSLFGRGFYLNDEIIIDNVRHEVIRVTTQMKNGDQVDEFEIIPMEGISLEEKPKSEPVAGQPVIIIKDWFPEDEYDQIRSDQRDIG